MLGLTWTVGTRRFRSWIPEEEEAYHFLVMWAPLEPREQMVFEMFEGLDELAGKMPMEPAAIAEALRMKEPVVRAMIASARRKVAEYYKYQGLPFPMKKRTKPEPEAL